MALLGRTKLQEYAVILQVGEVQQTDYVYAPDSEHAAWQALELSTDRNAKLLDVRKTYEW